MAIKQQRSAGGLKAAVLSRGLTALRSFLVTAAARLWAGSAIRLRLVGLAAFPAAALTLAVALGFAEPRSGSAAGGATSFSPVASSLSAGSCAGDCDGDGAVTVDELVTGVNMALGSMPIERCRALDRSGEGLVTVDEIILAVGNALDGCPAVAIEGAVFTVAERAGVLRHRDLVVGAVPLERGLVSDAERLAVLFGAEVIPAAFETTARWDDGSVRWALLRMPVDLDPGERRSFQVGLGKGVYRPEPPALPALALELESESGFHGVALSDGLDHREGGLLIQSAIEVRTERQALVRVRVAQEEGDARWRRLTLRVAEPGPHGVASGTFEGARWSGAVRDFESRGPMRIESTGTEVRIDFLSAGEAPLPADEGFHVSFAVLFEEGAEPSELARRLDAPLRPVFPLAYVQATGAAEDVGAVRPGDAYDVSFRATWMRLRERRERDPRNRGPRAFGDFFDGEHTLAYRGYLNQEYDPATAFFQFFLATGDEDALEEGLVMARQYADNGLSLYGGSHQHRATQYALQGHLGRTAGALMQVGWRGETPSVAAPPAAIVAWMEQLFGAQVAEDARDFLDSLSGTDVEREDAFREMAGWDLVVASERNFTAAFESVPRPPGGILGRMEAADPGIIARLDSTDPAEWAMRDFAILYASGDALSLLALPGVDALFASFFARYGGSWSVFAGFHFYRIPDQQKLHGGGHSLVEMVVWGYLFTGDPWLADAALRAARFHVEPGGVVERGIELVREQVASGAERVMVRNLGWPLLNLLSLEPIARARDAALHREIVTAIERLVTEIVAVPPARFKSTIHTAVCAEALARYHRRTGAGRAAQHLVDLARYWVAHFWNELPPGWMMDEGDPSSTSPGMTGLYQYGFTYAAGLAGDADLEDRARRAVATALGGPTSYAKSLGMRYRNTQRALALPLLAP